MSDVVVAGAGGVGLTCAAALREAGFDVEVVVAGGGVVGTPGAAALRAAGFDVEFAARDEPTVSEVAGGLWLPYSTGEDERTMAWARATYEWLEGRGVPLVDYLHIQREAP